MSLSGTMKRTTTTTTTTARHVDEEIGDGEPSLQETPIRRSGSTLASPTRSSCTCNSHNIMTFLRYFIVFCVGLAINPHDIISYFVDEPFSPYETIPRHEERMIPSPSPLQPTQSTLSSLKPIQQNNLPSPIPKQIQAVITPAPNTCELISKPYPIVKPVPGVCYEPPGQTLYITGQQNPGGGFGHQTSNVLYAMNFAQACNFTYVFHDYHGHCEKWVDYSGFGSGCINYAKDVLPDSSPYQVVDIEIPKLTHDEGAAILPPCSALKLPSIKLNPGKSKIVYKIFDAASYQQCTPIPTLRQWFWSGRIKHNPHHNMDWSCWVLVAHIRRGDSKGLAGRYLSLQVYRDILPIAYSIMSTTGYTHIHIYSDGTNQEIQPLLDTLPNARFLRGTVQQDWEGMVRADVFMHAKSSFSHQAGLLGDNIKLSPSFWHSTNCDTRWIQVDVQGEGEQQKATFDQQTFKMEWEKYVEYKRTHPRPTYG